MWWEVPSHLEKRNGELYVDGISTVETADKYGTPLHLLSLDMARDNYRRFHGTMQKYMESREVRIHYAMKTNSNPELLKLLMSEGAWIDAVTTGEAKFAIQHECNPQKILYTGSSVSDNELRTALDLGININIDSPSQLRRLRRILGEQEYRISLRLDPGERGAGHVPENITAGKVVIHGEEVPTKFGIDKNEIVDVVKWARKNKFIIRGLHFHIGSNWRTDEEIRAFLLNLQTVLYYGRKIREIVGYDFEFLDVGGGPGKRYRETHPEFPLEAYGNEIARSLNASIVKFDAIAFEPGRYISGDAGLLLSRVVDVKEKGDVWIVGVDTGFSQLPRPELYNSYHHVTIANRVDDEPSEEVIVVGRVCETGDCLTRDPIKRKMPLPREGDVIAFHTTGAYVKTMEMKSYNMLGPVKELTILNGKLHTLHEEEIISGERRL